jgi:hypothetical protein
VTVGEPAGQATLFGGTVVGAVALASGRTVAHAVATPPPGEADTVAVACASTRRTGVAAMDWPISVASLIRL